MTILAWVVSGIAAALLMGWIMHVPNNRLRNRIAVGIVAAFIGGAAVTIWTKQGVMGLETNAVAAGLIGSFYALFAYQCFGSHHH